MKRYLKLYVRFIKLSLIRAMIYKENFIIWSLVTIGWIILNIIFYQILYFNVDQIAGWTKPQVLISTRIIFYV